MHGFVLRTILKSQRNDIDTILTQQNITTHISIGISATQATVKSPPLGDLGGYFIHRIIQKRKKRIGCFG